MALKFSLNNTFNALKLTPIPFKQIMRLNIYRIHNNNNG